MTAEDIKSLMEEALPSIKERIKKEIADSAVEAAKWKLRDETAKALNDWIVAELTPHLKDIFEAQKPAIRQIAVDYMEQAKASITAALITGLNEKLKNSWERKKIAEAFFA